MKYIELLNMALNIIKMRYDNEMGTIHLVGNYGLKPMFVDKYSIAYTGCS